MNSTKSGIIQGRDYGSSFRKPVACKRDLSHGGGEVLEAFVSGSGYRVRYFTFLLLVVFADLSREHVVFRNLSRDQG